VIGAHLSIGLKPLVLLGSEAQKKKWLPDLATGKLVAAFLPHGARGGLRRWLAQDDGRLRRRDGHVRPERDEAVISNGGFASFFSVFAAYPVGPRRTATRKSPASRSSRTRTGRFRGLTRGPEEKKLGLCGLVGPARSSFENLPDPGREPHRREGPGLQVTRSRLSTPDARLSARVRSAARSG